MFVIFLTLLYSLVPPPLIVKQPQELVRASLGETIMLHCTAISYGSADNLKYHWFKVMDDDKKVVVNTERFVISHITSEYDNTSYQCAATNENGTTYSRTTKINSKIHTYVRSYK